VFALDRADVVEHAHPMSTTTVQIRKVPLELHRRLKARAATEGITMSDFIRRELAKVLERPPRQEVLERLRSRPVRRLKTGPAAALRSERDVR
jgi:antitoxin FitA